MTLLACMKSTAIVQCLFGDVGAGEAENLHHPAMQPAAMNAFFASRCSDVSTQ